MEFEGRVPVDLSGFAACFCEVWVFSTQCNGISHWHNCWGIQKTGVWEFSYTNDDLLVYEKSVVWTGFRAQVRSADFSVWCPALLLSRFPFAVGTSKEISIVCAHPCCTGGDGVFTFIFKAAFTRFTLVIVFNESSKVVSKDDEWLK